jgi:ferritin
MATSSVSRLFVLLAFASADVTAFFASPDSRSTRKAAPFWPTSFVDEQRTASSDAAAAMRWVRASTSTATTRLHMTPRPQILPRVPSDTMLGLFNLQVRNELEASQLYLSASIWCDANDFPGMASFFLSESNDERSHALSMIDFANKRSIRIRLSDLVAPDATWETPEDLWEDILTAEMENTQSLLLLGDEAAKCSDHVTTAFLMPYHMEQVNAEDSLRTILAKVRDENKTPGLLRQLDSELGSQAKAHLT